MIKLYTGSADNAVYINEHTDDIPRARRERMLRIGAEGKRRQSAAASLLLSAAFKDAGICADDMEYAANDHGKPYFKDCGIYFSLAHCDGMALCALSDVPVGCDIERIGRYALRAAEKYFTDREKEKIKASEDTRYEFLRIWTAKESVVKADGCGIAEDFGTLCCIGESVVFRGISYTVRTLLHEDFVISYAMRGAADCAELLRLF